MVSRSGQHEAPLPNIQFKRREPLCETLQAPRQKSPASHSGVEMQSSMKSSASVCKGLKNKKEGRFDQLWMVKWFDWYSYVKAHAKKVWDTSTFPGNSLLSATTRAESAKTAHAG